MRKKIKIYELLITVFCGGALLFYPSFARGTEINLGEEAPAEEEIVSEETEPLLRFFAINAGYKTSDGAQNYDFIELENLSGGSLGIGEYRIIYTNSVNTPQKPLTFKKNAILESTKLLLTAKEVAQNMDNSLVYDFGSAGLASTAGKLELWLGDTLQDEVCWGKMECKNKAEKFNTKEDENLSLVRCAGNDCVATFLQENYLPKFDETKISYAEEEKLASGCAKLIINEIYSYFEKGAHEQFIELYNASDGVVSVNGCRLQVKNTEFALSGEIGAGAYLAFFNDRLSLTKNPQNTSVVAILDENGEVVSSLSYPHGQKRGASYARILVGDEEEWRISYLPTPGSENIYQEYRSCKEGYVINILTGNCIKDQEDVEVGIICPEGKFLNPLTGRCKKIVTATLVGCKEGYERNPLTGRCRKIKTESTKAACKEGYERNPITGRCRKIRVNTGTDYPVKIENGSYNSPTIFVAGLALVGLLMVGVLFALWQFRKEISAILKRIRQRISNSI